MILRAVIRPILFRTLGACHPNRDNGSDPLGAGAGGRFPGMEKGSKRSQATRARGSNDGCKLGLDNCPTKTSFCGAEQTPPIIFLVSAPYSLSYGRFLAR